jgi:hypothetical protein
MPGLPISRRHLILTGSALAATAAMPVAARAQAPAPAGTPTDSPLVRQLYGGRWPDDATTRKVYDDFLLQRAVQAYMLTLPALNVIGMRDGSEATFGRGYHVLPIWKDRMGARTWVPTPNCDVVYSMSYLNLKETGPLVVYAPPNVIGMFTDFLQRTLTDVGAAGPDLGRGGLYLLLPPGYDGAVPGGYHAVRSRTYNVFLFFRTVLTAGPNGPDTTKAVATAEMTRVYPLGSLERNRPPMQFPNASPIRVNMMYPTDFTYWEKLKRFIDDEPVECLEPNVRGMLASLGIIKGQPFAPDARRREILTQAVETAARMIFAVRIEPEALPNLPYYPDRQYVNAWGGVDADFNAPSYQSIDQRASYFQAAYSSAPAMVVDAVGLGSKYPIAIRDANGELLDGNRSYRLRLPPNIPALLYWAVTIYNPADGTMPETAQAFPSRNQFDNVTTNADGSVELYFGPERPAAAPERNWIQTLRDRGFMVAVRLYGTNATFYDQSWRPDDIVRLG